MISKVTNAATIVAALATAVLRAIDHTSWEGALAITVAVLAARVAVMGWGVARRELPWSRLLLPAIILLAVTGDSTAFRLWVGGVLEVVVVVVAIRELRRVSTGVEPLEGRIARALEAFVPPRFARLVAFEVVIVGAALRFTAGGWRRPVPAGFTYHRESGLRLFLAMLPLLAVGDFLLLELVILPDAALWVRLVVHGVALYGVIWLIGLYASLRARPHQLVDGRLELRRGMLKRVVVRADQITSIDRLPSFADDWKQRAYCKGAIRIDIAGPTVLELRLRSAVRPIGVLGEGAAGNRVLVAVDDPTSFIESVRRSAA